MPPTVALLTDFGWRDPYVAAMKAVIAARCDARILDLGHEVAPGDIFEGAVFLAAVAPYLGPSTVVAAVVDPGVGTGRAILAGFSAGAVFLAPDNGLLTLLPIERFRRVEDSSLFLPGSSTTFHGRDRFAPVAAALASGASWSNLGPEVTDVVRLHYERPAWGAGEACGTVISIDRFGNVITDLEVRRLPSGRPVTARLGGTTVSRTASSYQEVDGEVFLIAGSRGTIEISASGRSAAELLQIARFERVELVWS